MTEDNIIQAAKPATAIITADDTPTIDRIIKRRQVIQQAMAKAMISGVDYGTIPGCGLKADATQTRC